MEEICDTSNHWNNSVLLLGLTVIVTLAVLFAMVNTRIKKCKCSKSIKHKVIFAVVPFKDRLMQQLSKYCFLNYIIYIYI